LACSTAHGKRREKPLTAKLDFLQAETATLKTDLEREKRDHTKTKQEGFSTHHHQTQFSASRNRDIENGFGERKERPLTTKLDFLQAETATLKTDLGREKETTP
jgi:hypothetical protein